MNFHAAQKEFDSRLSPPLLKVWISDQVIESKTRRLPEPQIEKQVGFTFGIVGTDLAALRKPLKHDRYTSNRTQPTLLMGKSCQFRKLKRLRRQYPL